MTNVNVTHERNYPVIGFKNAHGSWLINAYIVRHIAVLWYSGAQGPLFSCYLRVVTVQTGRLSGR